MSELHDLAAPYVMDALEAAERQAYEEHLAGCDQCRSEVGALREATLALAEASSTAPPPELKQRVMAGIRTPTGEVVQLAPRRRARWEWAFAAAAVVALVFAGLWVAVSGQLGQTESILAVLEAEDAVSVDLGSDVGEAEFVYSQELGQGVFLDRGLAEPQADRVYELWLVGDEGPVPAGIFRPEPELSLLVEGVSAGLVIAMTEEPPGGSEQPTGEILLSAELLG